MDTAPIDDCIERWHMHVRGRLDGGLDALLHEDCVFLSPIVFTPQRGREITKLYLRAAGSTLAGADPASEHGGSSIDDSSTFRYTTEILEGHHAMLEFETRSTGSMQMGSTSSRATTTA